jgi:hypothetical protein
MDQKVAERARHYKRKLGLKGKLKPGDMMSAAAAMKHRKAKKHHKTDSGSKNGKMPAADEKVIGKPTKLFNKKYKGRKHHKKD